MPREVNLWTSSRHAAVADVAGPVTGSSGSLLRGTCQVETSWHAMCGGSSAHLQGFVVLPQLLQLAVQLPQRLTQRSGAAHSLLQTRHQLATWLLDTQHLL